jgi:hypothetical protein
MDALISRLIQHRLGLSPEDAQRLREERAGDDGQLWVPYRPQAEHDADLDPMTGVFPAPGELTDAEMEVDRERRAERRLLDAESRIRRQGHSGLRLEPWQWAENDKLEKARQAAEDHLADVRADRLEREAIERRPPEEAGQKVQATQGDIPEPPRMTAPDQVALAERLLGPRGRQAALKNLSPITSPMVAPGAPPGD